MFECRNNRVNVEQSNLFDFNEANEWISGSSDLHDLYANRSVPATRIIYDVSDPFV